MKEKDKFFTASTIVDGIEESQAQEILDTPSQRILDAIESRGSETLSEIYF